MECKLAFLLMLYSSFLGLKANGQNLIVNPSFEDTSLMVQSNLHNWHKYFEHDTPDYFKPGITPSSENIFSEYMGGTPARDGEAFMGIFCYRANPAKNSRNIREYLEAPLVQSLEKDSIYKFSISVCLDEESNVIIRNFGILFNDKPRKITSSTKMFLTQPSIIFDSLWLTPDSGWICLKSLYRASGHEKYIAIGNFLPDNKTNIRTRQVSFPPGKKEKWKLSKHEIAAYCYLDKLELVKTSSQLSQSLPIPNYPYLDEFELDKIQVDSIVVLQNINFEFNSTQFIGDSYKDLERLLRLLNSNPAIAIKINGYTDNIGSRKYNLQLSLRRAKAVREYLLNEGIDPNRIEYEGFGYEKPLRENDTEENRKRNRRVEFVILKKTK